MVRKRLDDRIRSLLERSVVTGQRSMLVLVGDRGKDQVPNLHQILTKTLPASNRGGRPKVLWCYKKELGFSTHRMKRLKKLKRDKSRGLTGAGEGDSTADNFELFIGQTDINWCYYRDSHRILGSTVGMLILQDFEALTPNLMARTIETVQGGGLIIFLMRTVSSLKQLYAMSMDVHSRYRTDSAGDIVPRFNERFILSLGKCANCLVCDDELNVLPISRKALQSLDVRNGVDKSDSGEVIVRETTTELELRELQESLADTPHVGALIELTKTLDQAKSLLVFLNACSEKGGQKTTVAMTAARGRGKSASMGLCLAGAISLGYSTIAVTAPEPENLVAVFDFILRGLKALKYQEHMDYTVTYNNAKGREAVKCITSISIYRTHRQIIQYIPPQDTDKFLTSEIVAIDEAAAIPLPIVRALMYQQSNTNSANNDRLTFLSSTINGYEGTGRALSLKLIKELRELRGSAVSKRQATMDMVNAAADAAVERRTSKKGDAKVHEQRWAAAAAAISASEGTNGEKFVGPLREIELSTPIRYSPGDGVEAWLNKLLCLDCGASPNALKLVGGAPAPLSCELYSVDRDALFSYHKLSEAFLQKIMNLYTSAHYKNTPNDLQMLSDAPAHQLFVLLSPSVEKDSDQLPDVLAVIQVAIEGRISRKVIDAQLSRGHRSAGDLIPWTISQQFGDNKFAQLSGARIVRVAVHPSVQGMGYGSRAVELLYRFFNGEMISLNLGNDDDESNDGDNDSAEEEDSDNDDDGAKENGILGEKLKPRKELPPLLLPLSDVKAPKLDWIGTSFGLTLQLHKFWTRSMMKMLYLRQTKNELTGENSAIMIRALPRRTGVDDSWLSSFVSDTRRRFITLLGGCFRDMDIRQATSVLENLTVFSDSNGNSDGTRAGPMVGQIAADELDYYMTPHDMKRLELYGRNLCDHHLIADLIPVVARLYFLGRFDANTTALSSVQSALMCGIGLQQRSVDDLTKDLGLPSNQILAMFNKAVRKISITINTVVEEKEKKAIYLTDDQRMKAESMADKMRDVAETTLDDDVEDAANDAMEALRKSDEISALPPEISEDRELMQYVVKGSESQWKNALDDKIELDAVGTIQIQSKREKRKAVSEEDIEQAETKDPRSINNPNNNGKGKNSKGKSSQKKGKKSRR